MRLASKQYVTTNNYKPKLFSIRKDRKNGITVTSPKIEWKTLTPEQADIQWAYCLNILWERDKEGTISKDDLYPIYYKVLEACKFSVADINQIKKLKDWEIPTTVLAVGYLIATGAASYKQGVQYFINKSKELVKKARNTEVVVIHTKPKESIKDSPLSILIDQIQGFEDNILKVKVDFNKWIVDNSVTKEQGLAIIKFFMPKARELLELNKGSCEQLKEAYRRYNNAQVVYMIKWYINLFDTLKNFEYKAPVVVQRVRKTKPKTPEQLVKKLNYQNVIKLDNIELKSINPVKVIGSGGLICYNTKTRKVLVYVAKVGYTLSVEGSSLVNWDESKSHSKTMRKPDVQLTELLQLGKKPMLKYIESIRSKDSPVSGRINKDTVLITTV